MVRCARLHLRGGRRAKQRLGVPTAVPGVITKRCASRSGAPGQFAQRARRRVVVPDAAALWNAAELLLARVRLAPRLQIEELAGAVRELSGREPAELFADPAGLRALVHDDDLERYDDADRGRLAVHLDVPLAVAAGARSAGPSTTIVPWLDEHARSGSASSPVRAPCAARSSVELKRDDSYFDTLLQTINDGILVNDPDGAIDFVNSRLAAMLATTPEAMIGRRIFDYMDDDSAAAARSNLKRRRQGSRGPVRLPLPPRGRRRLLGHRPRPSRCSARSGEHRGSLVAITDITARRRVEEDLRQRPRRARGPRRRAHRAAHARGAGAAAGRDPALEASRTKSIFLANMSHELRDAAQRDHRLHRAAARGARRRIATSVQRRPRADPRRRQPPARAHQRHPRPVEDRGRPRWRSCASAA